MSLTFKPTRNKLLEVSVTTDPATPLVSTPDAKDYLNVPTSDDDSLIEAMVKGAVRAAENWTRRTFITHNVRTTWLGSAMPLRVFRPPIQEIDSVVTNFEGDPTSDTPANFYVIGGNGLRPRVNLKSDQDFEADDIEEVSITCVCGFGDAASDVPDDIIEAVKIILSHFYDNPDDFVNQDEGSIPAEAKMLLVTYQAPVV